MIWNSAKFLNALSGWFTSTCLIEQIAGTTQDDEGTPTTTWATLHADVPCSPPYAPNIKLVGQVTRDPGETYLIEERQISLKGVYRDVTNGMRVTIGGVVYLVELAYTDSQAVFTALLVREVDL
jgi:hypothetical protein